LGDLAGGDSPRGSAWNGCGPDRCTVCVNQHTWTAAPAGVMAGALPPHPRDFPLLGPPAWGGLQTATTEPASGKMSAPPWRIGLCGDATRAPSAGPNGTGGVLGRRPLSFSLPSQDIDEGDLPNLLLAAPMRQISGVRGQSPCPHSRQQSCPRIVFGCPGCQSRVAAGRLGAAGGWRFAASLALERLRVGCRNA
jgi:hypothetical protein